MNQRLEMNDLEKEFQVWFEKKYGQGKLEKNTISYEIGKGEYTKEVIKYTPDFNIRGNHGHRGIAFVIEVKGGSKKNEMGDQLKRKLVKEYFEVGTYTFGEYRKIGKEFFIYEHYIKELKKRKNVKKYATEVARLELFSVIDEKAGTRNYQTYGKLDVTMPIKVWEKKHKMAKKLLDKGINGEYEIVNSPHFF